MLAQAAIKGRLDEIFSVGSADPGRVVGTKYELRLAGDYLIDPDDRRYRANNTSLKGKLELRPGDVASVASVESFTMPWDLTASIGLKFSVVRQGIMPLVGSVVDPGYGQHAEDGQGERLYFLITNVSSKPVQVPIGEPILVLQFHEHYRIVDEDARAALEAAHHGGSDLRDAYENDKAPNPSRGLKFFTDMRLVKEAQDALEKRMEWVLLLGTLVVVSALIGAITTILIEVLSKPEIGDALANLDHLRDHPYAAVLLFVVVLTPFLMLLAWSWHRLRSSRRS